MMTSIVILGVICLVSVLLVIIGYQLAKRRFFSERASLSIDEVIAELGIQHDFDTDVYCMVLFELSKCIKLDIGKIRPTDTLEDLFALDSWDQNYAQEQFESWLLARVGRSPEFESAITIGDVVKIVQASEKNRDKDK